jgi:hypothetical protein
VQETQVERDRDLVIFADGVALPRRQCDEACDRRRRIALGLAEHRVDARVARSVGRRQLVVVVSVGRRLHGRAGDRSIGLAEAVDQSISVSEPEAAQVELRQVVVALRVAHAAIVSDM